MHPTCSCGSRDCMTLIIYSFLNIQQKVAELKTSKPDHLFPRFCKWSKLTSLSLSLFFLSDETEVICTLFHYWITEVLPVQTDQLTWPRHTHCSSAVQLLIQLSCGRRKPFSLRAVVWMNVVPRLPPSLFTHLVVSRLQRSSFVQCPKQWPIPYIPETIKMHYGWF